MRTVILAVLMIPGSAWGLGGAITETAGPYVSPSSAAATYVNKAGDTMTGPLGGTVGSFSGSVTASSGTFGANGNGAIALDVANTVGKKWITFTSGGYAFDYAHLSLAGNALEMAADTYATNFAFTGMKVGIGTASPCSTCTLHVAGGASVTGNMSVGTVTNDTKFDVKGAAVTPNSGLDAAQAIMSVYGAGQLGIGSDGASPFGMWMQTFDHTGTSPSAYPILLNPSLGSVGVGTNAPASKFHVSSGTIRIDGTGAPTTGGALCLNAGGAMAKCTSAIDASGNCTCP